MNALNKYIFIVIPLLMILTSCGTSQFAKKELDLEAKQFNINQDKSNVYIYRPKVLNFNTEMAVEIDGKHAANTEDATFIFQSLEPGKHIITAHGEGTNEIVITTKAGENYYILLDVRLGVFIPTPVMKLVDAKTGQAGIKKCKLVY